MLVVKKLESSLYVYVNYCALNAVTIKNRNALLIIKKTLARLSNVRYYTIINVITAFNKIRIKKGNKYKIAFLTRYKLFKYLVMLFSLCNASSTF